MAGPSIRDVAERAGVSTAVVSYVLNAGPRPVAPATRDRVERAIADLGYRRNAVARALRAGTSGSIGLLLPDIAKPFFGQLAAAVESAALERDVRVLMSSTRFDDSREAVQLEALLEARIDGLVVVPTALPEQVLRRAAASGVPAVVLHRDMRGRFPSVAGRDAAGGRLAAAHLLEHGHRTIGCLTGPTPGSPVARRADGVRRAVSAAGAGVDENLFVVCGYEHLHEVAYEKTLDLLRRRPDVTALVATTDEHAFAVVQAAAAEGRLVGVDLALVGIDGTDHSGYLTPGLTVVRTPFEQLGAAAVDLLIGAPADAPQGNVVSRRFDLDLVVRSSCGCPWSPATGSDRGARTALT